MPILPPQIVFPNDYDTNRTLYEVFNTTQTTITSDLEAWATTISIEPVAATEDELWATNGFATISGELLYYDAVSTDVNGKIDTLQNCVRNLGGKPPQFNPSGTDIRSFVLAEHHNTLARAIVNLQNFVGINFSENKITLDWRIRNLVNQPELSDDYGCPQVSFIYYITSTSPLFGTVIEYQLEITGTYDSFVIDFGDDTIDTINLTGTHTYPPNSNLDPTVTVASTTCTTVNSGIAREAPSEPVLGPGPADLNITIPDIPAIPDLTIQYADVSNNVNLPPIVFPCFDIGPFGPISIPSTITLDPPVVVPSQVVFSNIPVIPSAISVSPVSVVVSGDQFIDLVCVPIGGAGLNYSGFLVGGQIGNVATGMADKVAYKTDAVSSSATASIAASPRYGAASFSNSTHGYICGGYTNTYLSNVYRLDFSTETTASYGSINLSQARQFGVGLPNNDVKAYVAGGGVSGGFSNVIDKLVYATNTMNSSTSLQLATGRSQAAGVSQRNDKGYISGGLLTGTSNAATKNTELLQFASDTLVGKTTDELKTQRERFTGLDGNNTQGYYGGGRTNIVSTSILKSIEKMHYPSDSTVALYVELSVNRMNAGGLNEGSSKGYFAGGNTAAANLQSAQTATLQTLHYLTDTFSSVSSTMQSARGNMACLSHVYVPDEILPLNMTFTALDTSETNNQFTTLGNGYVVPQEAFGKPQENMQITYNGYDLPEEAKVVPPTPTNDLQASIDQAFRSVKIRIKEEQIAPSIEDLLGK